MMCLLQSKLSKYSFNTLAPRGLCDPSINNLLFFTKFLSLPFFISCSLAMLFILVIPVLIYSSLIFNCFKDLSVAIAAEMLSS